LMGVTFSRAEILCLICDVITELKNITTNLILRREN